MKLKELLEIFIDSLKYNRNTIEIYKNPDKKEILKINNDTIRFIIDIPNKNIYVFDSDMLHDSVARKLRIPYTIKNKDYIFGEGFIRDGKLYPNLLDMVSTFRDRYLKIKNEKWIKKYLN